VPVETVTVGTEDIEVTIDAVGTLRADRVVEITPKRPGFVREVRLQEGNRVEQGDVLVVLDDEDLRARVDVARASLVDAEVRERNARRQYGRMRELLERGVAAAQQHDDVKAELDRAVATLGVARANLAFAEAQLAESVVRAPFGGVLGQRRVDLGAYVTEGAPIVTLVDLDPIEIVFAVPERFVTQVATGRLVEARVASHGERRFEGTVTFVDPQVDPVNRTVTVKAVLANENLALRPGQFASVTLELDRHPQAAVIPEEAVVPDGDQTLVFVVRDGVAEARPIVTGVRLPGRVEVVSGVAAGVRIVRTGHEKLKTETALPVVDVQARREG
jgi:membrane fusion protein (multidrug efflux system)